MDLVKDYMTAVPAPAPNGSAAPINQFAKNPTLSVAPNSNVDTLYATAWLNLSKEPIVLECAQYERPVLSDADDRRLDEHLCITREAHHRNRCGELRHRRGQDGMGCSPPG